MAENNAQGNDFTPLGTERKETSKPIAGPIPDAQNRDTNANMGEDKANLTSRTAVESGRFPPPLDPSKFNQSRNATDQEVKDSAERMKREHSDSLSRLNDNDEMRRAQEHNPNPITAGSVEDRERSAGKYEGDVKVGQTIKVSPLNAADEDFVVGRVTGLDVSGLGQVTYLDETASARVASFHAEDAEILYETPEERKGKRVFINDDQTYDARELRAERPRNEKQYVEKQEVLREQTARSHFGKSLS